MGKKFNDTDPALETDITDIIGGVPRRPSSIEREQAMVSDRNATTPSDKKTPYEKRFLQTFKIDNLGYVYISKETKDKLGRALHAMGGKRMNMTCFIELILREHIEEYKDDINAIIKKRSKMDLL